MDYLVPELVTHAVTVAVMFLATVVALVSYAWSGR